MLGINRFSSKSHHQCRRPPLILFKPRVATHKNVITLKLYFPLHLTKCSFCSQLFQDAENSQGDDSHPHYTGHRSSHSSANDSTVDDGATGQREIAPDGDNTTASNIWKSTYRPTQAKGFIGEELAGGDFPLGHRNSTIRKRDKAWARVRHSLTSGVLPSSQKHRGSFSQANGVIKRGSSFKKRISVPDFTDMMHLHHQWKPPRPEEHSHPAHTSLASGSVLNETKPIMAQSHMTSETEISMSSMSSVKERGTIAIEQHLPRQTQPEQEWDTVKGAAALEEGLGAGVAKKDSITSNHAFIPPLPPRQRRRMAVSFDA